MNDGAGELAIEGLLAELSPQVLGALVARHRDFERCEDALQEALVSADRRWRRDGLPREPRAWLLTAANRRVVDSIRSDVARRERERRVLIAEPIDVARGAPDDELYRTDPRDDTLTLMFLCAHPNLSSVSQMALTLKAVGGLSTGEIASAFLVPEATMARRLSRAKATIDQVLAAGERLDAAGRRGALPVVRQVLYLIFNEGYSATSGATHQRHELAVEAIRLARLLVASVPGDPESVGLLALMLLTDSRHRARTDDAGALVPLAAQDRSLWDLDQAAQGAAMVLEVLPRGEIGPYQLQAAIAAVHSEAPSIAETDWAQILELYRVLERVAPSPMHSLSRVVAEAEVRGAQHALAELEAIERDPAIAAHHRVDVVNAHLLEQLGRTDEAAMLYGSAAKRSTNAAERAHLLSKSRELG